MFKSSKLKGVVGECNKFAPQGV
jgi:hypothetical protein